MTPLLDFPTLRAPTTNAGKLAVTEALENRIAVLEHSYKALVLRLHQSGAINGQELIQELHESGLNMTIDNPATSKKAKQGFAMSCFVDGLRNTLGLAKS